MTRRQFSIVALIIVISGDLTAAGFLSVGFWGDVLIFSGSILVYIGLLVFFHKYKINTIKKSFKPEQLWTTMRTVHDAIFLEVDSNLKSISIYFSASKGYFHVHEGLFLFTDKEPDIDKSNIAESRRIEFVMYFTFNIPFLEPSKSIYIRNYGDDTRYEFRFGERIVNERKKYDYKVSFVSKNRLGEGQVANIKKIIEMNAHALEEILAFAVDMKIKI